MLVLDLFLIGFVITVEPIPLSAMILLLAAERGLLKGLGYTLGWLLTLLGHRVPHGRHHRGQAADPTVDAVDGGAVRQVGHRHAPGLPGLPAPRQGRDGH